MRRSHVAIPVILRNARRLIAHPWIAAKLVALEGEKTFFNLLRPRHGNGWAGRLRQVGIRITDRCNLRCHTCGQWGDNGFLRNADLTLLGRQEVGASRYLELFEDLIGRGHRPMIYVWGGEPMLYPGMVDLIAALTRLRLPVSIATNGTGLAKAADRLVQAPLFLLQVSVDGHCAALHNRLRPAIGNTDNFTAICQGLDAVQAARQRQGTSLPLIACLTVISRENANHLEDIYAAFQHKVDLFVFYLAWWIDEAHASLHEMDFQRRFGQRPLRHRGWIGSWKPNDYEEIDRRLDRLVCRAAGAGRPPVTVIPALGGAKTLERYYTVHEERFGFDQCVSIHQTMEINSNGDVSPCRDYHDYVVGNVKHATLAQLWNAPAYRAFRQSLAKDGLMPVCARCCGLMGY